MEIEKNKSVKVFLWGDEDTYGVEVEENKSTKILRELRIEE